MNVVEKYHPTVDANGDRQVDKVKARLCVDGRAQLRDNYRPEEIESPTASISSIFAIAQISAAQDRLVHRHISVQIRRPHVTHHDKPILRC